MFKLEMHHTRDPGTINRMEGAPAANKLFVPEPTAKYKAGIQYSRLIHRCCASIRQRPLGVSGITKPHTGNRRPRGHFKKARPKRALH